jgi:hypothetical protein
MRKPRVNTGEFITQLFQSAITIMVGVERVERETVKQVGNHVKVDVVWEVQIATSGEKTDVEARRLSPIYLISK